MTDDKKENETGSETDDGSKDAPPPTLLVWLTRIVAVGLLTTIVGYLTFLSFIEDVPPEFKITPDFDGIVQHKDHYALPVSVRNGATEAVTEVNVEVTFAGVTRTLILPLMGQGEVAQIEVIFEDSPVEGAVETKVVAYQAP